MIAAGNFKITKAVRSKLSDLDLDNVPFGKYMSDHMLEADYEDGGWKTPVIRPYEPLLLQPSLAALHYGQAIFEGVKAYKNPSGNPMIFRPEDNFKRFNISAERMEMPQVPAEIFIDGMKQLVGIDSAWIPAKTDHSLYIRPFMISTSETIGVKPSEKYKFMIILSPTGPYYATPMRIYAEEKYVRAVPGGVGFVKAAGNYGLSMYPTAQAKRKGYDQVLWMDAFEHKYIQECGTMNVVFIINNKVITPDLASGTILDGVTRDSVLTLLRQTGMEVEERALNIDEVMQAHRDGTLQEVFGTGTAATISLIKELRYKEYVMQFETSEWKIAPGVKKMLNDIRYGLAPDTNGWMTGL